MRLSFDHALVEVSYLRLVLTTCLQSSLYLAHSQVQEYKDQIATIESDLTIVQQRLDMILEVTVTQHYDWDYLEYKLS